MATMSNLAMSNLAMSNLAMSQLANSWSIRANSVASVSAFASASASEQDQTHPPTAPIFLEHNHFVTKMPAIQLRTIVLAACDSAECDKVSPCLEDPMIRDFDTDWSFKRFAYSAKYASVKFRVSIFTPKQTEQTEQTDRYILEFQRVRGDRGVFIETICKLKKLLDRDVVFEVLEVLEAPASKITKKYKTFSAGIVGTEQKTTVPTASTASASSASSASSEFANEFPFPLPFDEKVAATESVQHVLWSLKSPFEKVCAEAMCSIANLATKPIAQKVLLGSNPEPEDCGIFAMVKSLDSTEIDESRCAAAAIANMLSSPDKVLVAETRVRINESKGVDNLLKLLQTTCVLQTVREVTRALNGMQVAREIIRHYLDLNSCELVKELAHLL